MACSCKKRKSKLSGMARKKGKITKVVKSGLPVAAGLAGGMIVSNIGFVKQNKVISIIAPFAGALLANSIFGPQVASGMVAGGVINGAKVLLPEVAQKVGLGYLPAAGSTSVHSVAGNYAYMD